MNPIRSAVGLRPESGLCAYSGTRPSSRVILVLAAALAALLAGCSGGGGGGDSGPGEDVGTIPEGGTVTEIRTSAPSADEFLLHATIPVPRNEFPRADGKIPFQIADYDGTLLETQMEIVSRYPGDLGADVVEVIARVQRDPAVSPGTLTTYRVVASPQAAPPGPGEPGLEDLANATVGIPPVVWDLLLEPGSIRIVATDCFGNEYDCHPLDGTGSFEVMRHGPNHSQVRVYQTMAPVEVVAGAQGTLPHLFGVHAYLSTYRNEELIGLDLRFNNAHSGHDDTTDQDDPLDKVYFEKIEVSLPTGSVLLQAYEDPYYGDAYTVGDRRIRPVVAPMGDGTMHAIRWQGQFHRRLMVATSDAYAQARRYLSFVGVGFASRGTDLEYGHEYYSWWNRGTSRYFPQSFQLPSLDHVGLGSVRGDITWSYDHLRNHLVNGTSDDQYPVEAGVHGWGHPYGVSYGGMTGGSEIHISDGLATVASGEVKGVAYFRALHRMQTDRMPNALYNVDGEPTSVEDWVIQVGPGQDWVPFEHYIVPVLRPDDPFGFDDAPQFQIDHVEGTGLQPEYYWWHMGYDPYDYQHYVRYTRGAKVLAWLDNDSIAKDDLRCAAEMFNLSYHQHLNNSYGGYQGSGLRGGLEYVAVHAGKGFSYGRGEAWGLDCMNAAYATSSPEWRATKREWFDLVTVMISDGQAWCSGFIQSQVVPKFIDGKYHARQAIEGSITENSLRGVWKTVYEREDPALEALSKAILRDSLYAFVSDMAWWPGETAPWSHTAVGPKDVWEPIWCSWSQLPSDGYTSYYENFQNWSSFAYAYELTNDPKFLSKAALEAGDPDLLWALEQAGLSNIENMASLLALAQRLNGDI